MGNPERSHGSTSIPDHDRIRLRISPDQFGSVWINPDFSGSVWISLDQSGWVRLNPVESGKVVQVDIAIANSQTLSDINQKTTDEFVRFQVRYQIRYDKAGNNWNKIFAVPWKSRVTCTLNFVVKSDKSRFVYGLIWGLVTFECAKMDFFYQFVKQIQNSFLDKSFQTNFSENLKQYRSWVSLRNSRDSNWRRERFGSPTVLQLL